MPNKLFVLTILSLAWLPAAGHGATDWKLPPVPPAERYGALLLDRVAAQGKVKPVSFSHGVHRQKFTCRVCHGELDFAMKRNATGITEEGNRKGRYCGACHNGIVSFAVAGNCDRCHTGSLDRSVERFRAMASLPRNAATGGIDWGAALDEKIIAPARFLADPPRTFPFRENLTLEGEWDFVPPVTFSHRAHVVWLDCTGCHPDIFTVKRKGTRDFTMRAMLDGRFCGACHSRVAFPMDDCRRCHPGMSW